MHRLRITIIIFVLLPVVLSGQIRIHESLKGFITAGEPSFLIDQGSRLDFAEIQSQHFGDSMNTALRYLGKGNIGNAVWAKLTLQINRPLQDSIQLRIPVFTRCRVYVVYPSEIDTLDRGFFDIKSNTLERRDKDAFAIAISGKSKATVTLYFKIRSKINFTADRITFDFKDKASRENAYLEKFHGYTKYNSYLYLTFCGMLIFQLFYISMQWIFVRRIEYLYYVLYIIGIFLYFYNRYCQYYSELPQIAFSTPHFVSFLNDILLVLPSFFYFRFARYFADLKLQDPVLNKAFKIGEWVLLTAVLLLVGLQLIPNSLPKNYVMYIVVVLEFFFAIYALRRIFLQHRTVAYFLVAGSACAMLSHASAMLLPLTISSWNNQTDSAAITIVGLILEIGIFNTGLLFKARETETERILVQDAYINELKSKEILRQEYDHVRDKIASDLHDDIGSTLSSISIYSYAARQKLEQGETGQINELLANIERNTILTISSMGDLVWAVNPLNDSTEKLMQRIRTFAFDLLTAKNCRFNMEVDEALYSHAISQAQRKNILLICKEALNNSAKYANASEAQLSVIHLGDDNFEFSVCDNGIGFTPDFQKGNGLRTMHNRANDLGGNLEIAGTENGTCIKFVLQL